MVSLALCTWEKSLASSYYYSRSLTHWPKSATDTTYNPTYNDLDNTKSILAPINASLSLIKDMNFNYTMLTTAEY